MGDAVRLWQWCLDQGCEECIIVLQDTGIDQFTDLVGLSLNDLRTLGVPEGAVGPLFFAVKKEAEALWTGTETGQSLCQSLPCVEVEFVHKESEARPSTVEHVSREPASAMPGDDDGTTAEDAPEAPVREAFQRQSSLWGRPIMVHQPSTMVMEAAVSRAEREAKERLAAEMHEVERQWKEDQVNLQAAAALRAEREMAALRSEQQMIDLIAEVEKLRRENELLTHRRQVAQATAPLAAPAPVAAASAPRRRHTVNATTAHSAAAPRPAAPPGCGLTLPRMAPRMALRMALQSPPQPSPPAAPLAPQTPEPSPPLAPPPPSVLYKWADGSWVQMEEAEEEEAKERAAAKKGSGKKKPVPSTAAVQPAAAASPVSTSKPAAAEEEQLEDACPAAADIDGEVAGDYSGRSVALSADGIWPPPPPSLPPSLPPWQPSLLQPSLPPPLPSSLPPRQMEEARPLVSPPLPQAPDIASPRPPPLPFLQQLKNVGTTDKAPSPAIVAGVTSPKQASQPTKPVPPPTPSITVGFTVPPGTPPPLPPPDAASPRPPPLPFLQQLKDHGIVVKTRTLAIVGGAHPPSQPVLPTRPVPPPPSLPSLPALPPPLPPLPKLPPPLPPKPPPPPPHDSTSPGAQARSTPQPPPLPRSPMSVVFNEVMGAAIRNRTTALQDPPLRPPPLPSPSHGVHPSIAFSTMAASPPLPQTPDPASPRSPPLPFLQQLKDLGIAVKAPSPTVVGGAPSPRQPAPPPLSTKPVPPPALPHYADDLKHRLDHPELSPSRGGQGGQGGTVARLDEGQRSTDHAYELVLLHGLLQKRNTKSQMLKARHATPHRAAPPATPLPRHAVPRATTFSTPHLSPTYPLCPAAADTQAVERALVRTDRDRLVLLREPAGECMHRTRTRYAHAHATCTCTCSAPCSEYAVCAHAFACACVV